MRNLFCVALLGVSLAGVPMLVGCDDKKVTTETKTHTNADGTTTTDKAKTTTDANGNTSTSTEHKTTP